MYTKRNRVTRWLLLVASGAVVLNAAGCDFYFQAIQTGLLGALTVMTFFLARNV